MTDTELFALAVLVSETLYRSEADRLLNSRMNGAYKLSQQWSADTSKLEAELESELKKRGVLPGGKW